MRVCHWKLLVCFCWHRCVRLLVPNRLVEIVFLNHVHVLWRLFVQKCLRSWPSLWSIYSRITGDLINWWSRVILFGSLMRAKLCRLWLKWTSSMKSWLLNQYHRSLVLRKLVLEHNWFLHRQTIDQLCLAQWIPNSLISKLPKALITASHIFNCLLTELIKW